MKVTAHATRSGDWWAVQVAEVPGVFTQVRRLDQVATTAAEAVADLLEVDPASVEVELSVALGEHVAPAVDRAREAAEAAVAAQSEASTAMRLAVKLLRYEEGLSTRDAAVLLGVSHQRVSQLES